MSTLQANNFPSIDAALDAAENTGSAVAFSGVNVTSGFRLRNGVKLIADGSALIRWMGGPGTIAGSAPETILRGAGIEGIDFDSRDATCVIDLSSALDCTLRDITAITDNRTATVLKMRCNDAGEVNEWGNRNTAYNNIDGIKQKGRCGSLLKLEGIGPAGGPPEAVVTLNSFRHLSAAGVHGVGLDFAQWCDSNEFEGVTYLNLQGNDAIGAEFNSAMPTANAGVYANRIAHLAVDTWGSMARRIGMRLNHCSSIGVAHFAQYPVAEGGDLVISSVAAGFVIRLLDVATGGYVTVDPVWLAGYLFSFSDGGVNQLVVDKSGNTIQRGIATVGAGLASETAGIEVGTRRSASGISYIDLGGDAMFADYGLRMVRMGGPNGNATLCNRGRGDLQLQAQDDGGRVTLTDYQGVTRVLASKSGVGFNGAPAARPTVSGGTVKDANLRAALHTLGLIVNL